MKFWVASYRQVALLTIQVGLLDIYSGLNLNLVRKNPTTVVITKKVHKQKMLPTFIRKQKMLPMNASAIRSACNYFLSLKSSFCFYMFILCDALNSGTC